MIKIGGHKIGEVRQGNDPYTAIYLGVEKIYSVATIDFADQAVKALCVSNWGGNVVEGEITKGEAAAVTSLGGVFRGNTQITSFDELRFFTGLTGFSHPSNNNAQGEFYNCTALQSITFPNIQLQDADLMGLIRNCNSLKSVDLTPIKANSYHINYMLNLASTNALKDITLPSGYYGGGSGVLSYARYAMRNCNQMTTLKINGVADWSGISSYQESNVATSMFYNCSSLTTIIGTITGIKADLYMNQCPLTADSAMVIINGLADLTGQTGKTLTLSSTTKSALTAAGIDYAAIASAKNWNIPT